jgi:hypothetical protein
MNVIAIDLRFPQFEFYEERWVWRLLASVPRSLKRRQRLWLRRLSWWLNTTNIKTVAVLAAPQDDLSCNVGAYPLNSVCLLD